MVNVSTHINHARRAQPVQARKADILTEGMGKKKSGFFDMPADQPGWFADDLQHCTAFCQDKAGLQPASKLDLFDFHNGQILRLCMCTGFVLTGDKCRQKIRSISFWLRNRIFR